MVCDGAQKVIIEFKGQGELKHNLKENLKKLNLSTKETI